jgi:serine kinase of HPr protein (carbohydrate metabolism regulator)
MTVDRQSSETVHATCVAVDGHAILLCGRSGSGKSDLALRLIDRGAVLVSDDYTILQRSGDQLIARAPHNIAGKIEVRGLGILEMQAVSESQVWLCIALDEPSERMPEDADTRTMLGISIPFLALNAFEFTAAIKAELALHRLVDAVHNEAQGS